MVDADGGLEVVTAGTGIEPGADARLLCLTDQV